MSGFMNALIQQIHESLLNLIGDGVRLLPGYLMAIAVLLFTRYLAQFVRRMMILGAKRTLRSQSLQLLFTQLSYVATWIAGILVACVISIPTMRLGDVIGLLGLSSVAISFAFQDIFKNFLAGVLLLLNEPFRLGDQIIVDDYEGTVDEITIRATQIRTYDGERVVIPNALVFTSPVHVLTAFPHRRTDLEIGVHYQTNLPEAVQTLYQSLLEVEGVLPKPTPEVDVVSFGDSSINLMVRYWTLPQIMHVRRTKSRVIMALKATCDRANINIPFPIRTLQIEVSKELTLTKGGTSLDQVAHQDD
jgi:small-conductance mechanosensitive channel